MGYIIILARKFTINQSDSTYGADVMMGPVTPPAASSVP
ncbi:Putative inner membrane protein [Klebsiella pneumoniae]|nr:Putative inner membrane protein [Klebsiella pneumoniae]